MLTYRGSLAQEVVEIPQRYPFVILHLGAGRLKPANFLLRKNDVVELVFGKQWVVAGSVVEDSCAALSVQQVQVDAHLELGASDCCSAGTDEVKLCFYFIWGVFRVTATGIGPQTRESDFAVRPLLHKKLISRVKKEKTECAMGPALLLLALQMAV